MTGPTHSSPMSLGTPSNDFYRTVSLSTLEAGYLDSDKRLILEQLKGHEHNFRMVDRDDRTCLFLVRHREVRTQTALIDAAADLKRMYHSGNKVYLHLRLTVNGNLPHQMEITEKGYAFNPHLYEVGTYEMTEGKEPAWARPHGGWETQDAQAWTPEMNRVFRPHVAAADAAFERDTAAALKESLRSVVDDRRALARERMKWPKGELDALWCPCSRLCDYQAEPCGCKELCAACYDKYDRDKDLTVHCAKCDEIVIARKRISDKPAAPRWYRPLSEWDILDVDEMEDVEYYGEEGEEMERWEEEMWEK